jgi:hypothetical protein
MKNKTLLFLILAFISVPGFSQTEEVYKTIAKETCDCLAKKNFDYKKAGKAEIQMALGLCMMESAQRSNLTIDPTNMQQMTELGQKIGLQMAPICPEVFQAFTEDAEKLMGQEEEEEDPEFFTLSGKVKSVEEKDFFYINVKESTGKENKFIWLYYFDGSDEFKDDPKKLIGKDVTITYMLLEVLQPKSKVYYNLNVISGLEIK